MNAINEEWRPVVGAEESYEVSSLGFVRRTKTGKPKALRASPNGYLQTNIKGRPVGVHRLVASAFCNRVEGQTEVNHLNLNRVDNRACNLEWTTRSGNAQHAVANGHFWHGHLSDAQRRAIAILRHHFTAREIGAMFGVCRKTIVRVALHPQWQSFQQPKRAA